MSKERKKERNIKKSDAWVYFAGKLFMNNLVMYLEYRFDEFTCLGMNHLLTAMILVVLKTSAHVSVCSISLSCNKILQSQDFGFSLFFVMMISFVHWLTVTDEY